MNKKNKNISQIWSRQSHDEQKVVLDAKIKKSSGPGLYNLNAYDIEFRMRKKKDHA
jgi:hypothetical protein